MIPSFLAGGLLGAFGWWRGRCGVGGCVGARRRQLQSQYRRGGITVPTGRGAVRQISNRLPR